MEDNKNRHSASSTCGLVQGRSSGRVLLAVIQMVAGQVQLSAGRRNVVAEIPHRLVERHFQDGATGRRFQYGSVGLLQNLQRRRRNRRFIWKMNK